MADEVTPFPQPAAEPAPVPESAGPVKAPKVKAHLTQKGLDGIIAWNKSRKGIKRPNKKPSVDKLHLKRKRDRIKFMEASMMAVVSQGGIKKSPHLGPVTHEDRAALNRIAGMAVEEFNAHLEQRLGILADKFISRMEQKLDANEFKAGELAFATSVVFDKRNTLQGRNQLTGANVSIQVNNFSVLGRTREEMIRSLTGQDDKVAEAIPIK